MAGTPQNGIGENADGSISIRVGGTERVKLDSTGVSFMAADPVAQQAHIADVSVTGTYATDDTPIETAINSIIAVLEAFGLTATS
jgi:hypothetical protein